MPPGRSATRSRRQPRWAALTAGLDGLASNPGGAVSFTSLRILYTDAVANFRDGQTNSVLVITSGPHTDQSLDGPGLQEFIRAHFAPARPVAVNVIDLGDDPDRADLGGGRPVTGGQYQNRARFGLAPRSSVGASTTC